MDAVWETVPHLLDELEDWRESRARSLEPCPDEHHCSCVPFLHSEIDRLRAALKRIAQAPNQIWMVDVAKEALSDG